MSRRTEPGLPSSADPIEDLRREAERRATRAAATLPPQMQRLRDRLTDAESALARLASGDRAAIGIGFAVEGYRILIQLCQIVLGVLDVERRLDRLSIERELDALRIDAASSYSGAYAERARAEHAAARAEAAAERIDRARWSPWVACAFMAGAVLGGLLVHLSG